MKPVILLLLASIISSCVIRNVRNSPGLTDQAPALSTDFKNQIYNGQMTVTGQLQLIATKADYSPLPGPVTVTLDSPGLFDPAHSIWSVARGDRKLIIRDQKHEFEFFIPKDLMKPEGIISVHKQSAKQAAHLVIKRNRILAKSFERTETMKCPRKGTYQVVNQYNEYHMDLNIRIYNELGSAEINTNPIIEISQPKQIKELSSCE